MTTQEQIGLIVANIHVRFILFSGKFNFITGFLSLPNSTQTYFLSQILFNRYSIIDMGNRLEKEGWSCFSSRYSDATIKMFNIILNIILCWFQRRITTKVLVKRFSEKLQFINLLQRFGGDSFKIKDEHIVKWLEIDRNLNPISNQS